MDYRIKGFPVIIEITAIHGKRIPSRTNADPENCHEAEYPEISYAVLTRQGKPAPWIACKLTAAEAEEIAYLLLKELEDERRS